MAYKIKTEKFRKIKNQIGNSLSDIEYAKLLNDNISNFKKLLLDFQNLTPFSDVGYLIAIEYNSVPPKTKRILFNENPNNIFEVRQKALKSELNNNTNICRIFYQISYEELQNQIKILNSIIEKNNDISITTKKKKIRTFIEPIKIYKPFSPNSIIGTKMVSLLYIEDAIEDLRVRNILNDSNFDENLNIAVVGEEEYKKIYDLYPWIIIDIKISPSFSAEPIDISDLNINIEIGEPQEIVVGVIDSGLNISENLKHAVVSVEDWREFGNFRDSSHGTLVSSLIIANDELNESSKDFLGNMKVKHFEVLEPLQQGGGAAASFLYLKNALRKICNQNKEIKVWNLSFGSLKMPYSVMVSELGSVIDKISFDNDQLFVIAAGNDRKKANHILESLNSPGDSLNSITVGSVFNEDDEISFANYSSIGNTQYYLMPEVSSFGGPTNYDGSKLTSMIGEKIIKEIEGTSFSAPRIARIAAKLISSGYTTLEAKAKIISLAKRETNAKKSSAFGYVENEVANYPEMTLTWTIEDKDPQILDIFVPDETEKIILSYSNLVRPRKVFGDEYSINDIEPSIIVYDKTSKEPERDKMKMKLKAKDAPLNRYLKEDVLRMESMKYFNSNKIIYEMEKNNTLINTFIQKKNISEENIGFALRIKKLDLFDTVDKQEVSFAVNIKFIGNINIDEFERKNGNIIDNEITIEQEIEM